MGQRHMLAAVSDPSTVLSAVIFPPLSSAFLAGMEPHDPLRDEPYVPTHLIFLVGNWLGRGWLFQQSCSETPGCMGRAWRFLSS